MLLGPLVWKKHSGVPLLSAIVAIPGFRSYLYLSLSLFPCFHSILCHRTNQSCCPRSLSCLLSFLRHPFLSLVHSSAPVPRYHVPAPFGPSLACSLASFVPFPSDRTHTSSCDMSFLASESLCVVFGSCVPTVPSSIGPGASSDHHFVDDDLQFFHEFKEFFYGPARNSRLMSFGIISLTTNVFCASSVTWNWCSYSATFNDHAVSFSFNSFASLHLWVAAPLLDRSMTWARTHRRELAMPRTHDLALLE